MKKRISKDRIAKKKDLEWSGFELGISDYQTDALDHSASLNDIQNSEKCHT